MSSKKKHLRIRLLAERSEFTEDFALISSQKIFDQLKTLDLWGDKKNVHIYLPIKENKEVDTWDLISWLLSNNHEVFCSVIENGNFCKIQQNTVFKKGELNVPVPCTESLNSVDPDIIIVPCLAADITGNRLGYGKGWYDKFLVRHPQAKKIGLVYDQLLMDEIPSEDHDIKLDVIVTEKRIVHTKV
jgi:5-formyltetrahydrofolate cyclo-ligase